MAHPQNELDIFGLESFEKVKYYGYGVHVIGINYPLTKKKCLVRRGPPLG